MYLNPPREGREPAYRFYLSTPDSTVTRSNA
ncbi:hypothetical protein SAMN05421747_11271 [Parapedobacter composti]|uniref:Uncharacterized protein n=1 Tax=Parapedobacter composti TaxID=623281 RepID=A0A1I1JJ52_9SPHI|nr:hypothetical protein SAMN05421747_11271 [Parapedobacter composti]